MLFMVLYLHDLVMIDSVFFLMLRRPPRSTRTDTLFPYTTLFRSTHAADYHPVAGSFERHLGRAAIRIWPPSLDRRTDGDRALIHQYPSTSLIAFVYLDRKSTRLTPVTNAHLVCRLLIEKKKTKK